MDIKKDGWRDYTSLLHKTNSRFPIGAFGPAFILDIPVTQFSKHLNFLLNIIEETKDIAESHGYKEPELPIGNAISTPYGPNVHVNCEPLKERGINYAQLGEHFDHQHAQSFIQTKVQLIEFRRTVKHDTGAFITQRELKETFRAFKSDFTQLMSDQTTSDKPDQFHL